MPYTEEYDVIVNKIAKSLYDTKVANGDITAQEVAEQVWIFTDDQFVSVADITKLAGIETGAQVNLIEGVQVNGAALTPNAKVVNIVVPTKTSDLNNDSNFITKSVSNLENYYSKSEVNNLIATNLSMQVVASLPTSNISTSTIYLILKAVGSTNNLYNEYIYTNGSWELIGDTAVDLTGYALSSDLPTKLSDLTNDLDLSAYSNVIESVKVNGVALTPTNKAVDITLPQCEAGAECNTIETIKVNGTALTPDTNKAVDIPVPNCKTRIWTA